MLRYRVLSALVLMPLVLLATYFGNLWFFAIICIAALLASYEYFSLLKVGGYRPLVALGLLLVFLFLVDGLYPDIRVAGGSLALLGLLGLAWQVGQGNAPGSLLSWALTLSGAVYVGWSAQHFLALRSLEGGLQWILLTFAITWICDSGAYFVGRWKGKHPFFPLISPKKTREGAIGGAVTGVAAGLIGGMLVHLPWYHALALGVLGVLGATFGDLAESVVKRQVGVKDSSHLIPGHGGMLDRIDSLLFNAVIVFYYLYWVVGLR